MRNSSLVERFGVDNNRALSILPKLWIVINYNGRGAFQYSVEGVRITYSGAAGKANVGISNDKGGEKPPRRKTKDS